MYLALKTEGQEIVSAIQHIAIQMMQSYHVQSYLQIKLNEQSKATFINIIEEQSPVFTCNQISCRKRWFSNFVSNTK